MTNELKVYSLYAYFVIAVLGAFESIISSLPPFTTSLNGSCTLVCSCPFNFIEFI